MRTLVTILLVSLAAACATNNAGRPAEPVGTVARVWHSRTTSARAAEYYDYLMHEGIAKIEALPKNRGCDVLTRSHDGETEFIVISYWSSLEDIKSFAGDDITKTHNLPGDAEMLLELEPNVRHFEVRHSVRR